MNDINKEYLYINGYPICIINGNHKHVLFVLKNDILPQLKDVYRILLVDELHDKYYHYEVYNNVLRRIHCVCFDELDRERHSIYRDLF